MTYLYCLQSHISTPLLSPVPYLYCLQSHISIPLLSPVPYLYCLQSHISTPLLSPVPYLYCLQSHISTVSSPISLRSPVPSTDRFELCSCSESSHRLLRPQSSIIPYQMGLCVFPLCVQQDVFPYGLDLRLYGALTL